MLSRKGNLMGYLLDRKLLDNCRGKHKSEIGTQHWDDTFASFALLAVGNFVLSTLTSTASFSAHIDVGRLIFAFGKSHNMNFCSKSKVCSLSC